MSAHTITFEEGYRRLQTISERLGADEVPVHEMCDLFAEGKGLEQALSQYLAEQKARVEAIERGEGVQPFRIVAPTAASHSSHAAGDAGDGQALGELDALTGGDVAQATPARKPRRSANGADTLMPSTRADGRASADDEIPF